MRILITGAAGFAARHLARELVEHHAVLWGIDRADPAPPMAEYEDIRAVDISNVEALTEAVRKARPDACIHLAAVASVPICRDHPRDAWVVNATGTLHMLEAMRTAAPEARILVVSSAHACSPPPESTENTRVPDTFYGVTKLCGDILSLHYARERGMDIRIARPVNHIGPGQSESFAMSAFAKSLADISNGRSDPVLRAGNLESTRDFLDVRDTVRGYRLLLEKGRPGLIYPLAGGQQVPVGEALAMLCRIAGIHPRIEIDPVLFRPTDHSPALDTSQTFADTGWKPEIGLEKTLRDIFDSHRVG